MDLKQHVTDIQKVLSALKNITKPRNLPDLDFLELLKKALSSAQAIRLNELIPLLDNGITELQLKIAESLKRRREDLLQAARESSTPHKRYNNYDKVAFFKISYPGKKVRLEIGSEVFSEFEEPDGKIVFAKVLEAREALEKEAFPRDDFFALLKQAYRLAKEKLQPTDGWVPIRTLYSFFVLLRHVNFKEFVNKPEMKNFRSYSTSQFIYDLAKYGRKDWSMGDEILRTRTPNMVTVASGQTMTLPNLDSIEVPGPQLAVLKIEKRQ